MLKISGGERRVGSQADCLNSGHLHHRQAILRADRVDVAGNSALISSLPARSVSAADRDHVEQSTLLVGASGEYGELFAHVEGHADGSAPTIWHGSSSASPADGVCRQGQAIGTASGPAPIQVRCIGVEVTGAGVPPEACSKESR